MNFELGAHVQMKKFFNNMESFSTESCIRSYPIYNEIWNVNVEELPRQSGNGNCTDLFVSGGCLLQ